MRWARLVWMAALCSLAACDGSAEDGSTADEDAVLYLEVEALVRGSCALTRCHGRIAGAGLELLVEDLTKPLLNLASCEYPRMPLVAPGNPDGSWLMVKVGGPVREDLYLPFIDFQPDSSWDPATRATQCHGQLPDGNIWFGVQMPADAPVLAEQQQDLLRRWIEAGAPGPPADHDAGLGCWATIAGCDGGT